MAYSTETDLVTVGLPATALGSNITPAQVTAQLQADADLMDSYFRARWGTASVPLVAWDTNVRRTNAKLSAFGIMTIRGMSPTGKDYAFFRQMYEDAVAWLDKVQRQQAHPLVTLAGVNLPGSVQPKLNSASVVNLASGRKAPNRGW